MKIENLITIEAGAALFLVVLAIRHLLARGGLGRLHLRAPEAQRLEVAKELRPVQRLMAAYVVVRGVGLLLDTTLHVSWVTGLFAFATFLGATGALRLASLIVVALMRLRGVPVPRILRTLIDLALTLIVAAVVLRSIYKFDLSSLVATSALISVVLGFALQETLGNLFAGLTLHAEQPFERGEWISFSKYHGKVVDVGWRSTRIVTLEDDEILVPNSLLSREPVINHSRPTPVSCIDVMVKLDFEVSPARAKAVMLEAVKSCPLVLATPPPQMLIFVFEEQGLQYRVRFYISEKRLERPARDQVKEALWYALRRANIELSPPQQLLSFRERASEAEERRKKESMAEAQDLLSRIDFVAALGPDARETLAERARYVEYGPGEAVIRQGEHGEAFFLVAHGELAVRIKVENAEKEVARLNRGAFFGEMSMLTGDPRTATVVSLGDSRLMAVDRDAFERVFAKDPGVAKELTEVITRRKLALASAKAEGAGAQAAVEKETTNLLSRIRSIFRARGAA